MFWDLDVKKPKSDIEGIFVAVDFLKVIKYVRLGITD